jgi:hypothetical protein
MIIVLAQLFAKIHEDIRSSRCTTTGLFHTSGKYCTVDTSSKFPLTTPVTNKDFRYRLPST